MQRPQLVAAAVALGLAAVIAFGMERRPPELRGAERVALEVSSGRALVREALPSLGARAEARIHGLSKQLEAAEAAPRRAELLAELSGAWYEAGHPAVAGYYAETLAEESPTDTAWGIAATTYTLCLRADSLTEKAEAFCREHAVRAYENAISLAPAEASHRVNLAVFYADNPPADNPMRGIRMLLDLNREQPENVAVLVQLGRLALQTNQLDRARERLGTAVELAPDNASAQCLLAEAAQRIGDDDLAARSQAACRALLADRG